MVRNCCIIIIYINQSITYITECHLNSFHCTTMCHKLWRTKFRKRNFSPPKEIFLLIFLDDSWYSKGNDDIANFISLFENCGKSNPRLYIIKREQQAVTENQWSMVFGWETTRLRCCERGYILTNWSNTAKPTHFHFVWMYNCVISWGRFWIVRHR